MTETNVERIERIKKDFQNTLLFLGRSNGKVQFGSDVNWLIERVERAEELEKEIKSHAPEGRNYTNEQYVSLRLENKRYLEALEFYAERSNYIQNFDDRETGYPPEIMNDTGWKARQALSGESHE